jgi:hypothetical protein
MVEDPASVCARPKVRSLTSRCAGVAGHHPAKARRGLGLSTIVDFEKSRRDVSRTAVHAMQKALEEAGIQFLAKNGAGPGVRLRQ